MITLLALLLTLFALAKALVDITRHAAAARDLADGDEIDETILWIPITLYREGGVLMAEVRW